jgi:hypothetical protein
MCYNRLRTEVCGRNFRAVTRADPLQGAHFGETQISRFRDRWLLLKMVWFAYRKLKAV